MPPPTPVTDEQRAELRDTLGEFDARDTIEEKIRQLQSAKAELARSIVQEDTLGCSNRPRRWGASEAGAFSYWREPA